MNDRGMSCGPALAVGRFIYNAARVRDLLWREMELTMMSLRLLAYDMARPRPQNRDEWYVYLVSWRMLQISPAWYPYLSEY